jgi:hypothetical protein
MVFQAHSRSHFRVVLGPPKTRSGRRGGDAGIQTGVDCRDQTEGSRNGAPGPVYAARTVMTETYEKDR